MYCLELLDLQVNYISVLCMPENTNLQFVNLEQGTFLAEWHIM